MTHEPTDDLDNETGKAPPRKKLPLAVSYEERKRVRELRRQGSDHVIGYLSSDVVSGPCRTGKTDPDG
jgi:hypothetical protein